MTTVLGRIGRGAARHPWRVLVGFVLALMVVGGAAGGLGPGSPTRCASATPTRSRPPTC